MKNKNHDEITKDYNKAKSQHLEKLVTKMLKQDEVANQLKSKEINPDFLNLFLLEEKLILVELLIVTKAF